jgi:hypothetical protein
MRCGYVVPIRWIVVYEYGVPGGALNLNSTNYPDHGHHGDILPYQGKIPMVARNHPTPCNMIKLGTSFNTTQNKLNTHKHVSALLQGNQANYENTENIQYLLSYEIQ